jgi:hypothetical protein
LRWLVEARGTLGWAGVALGLLVFGSAILHQVAVTVVAFQKRGGYDLRVGTLLALGFGVMLAGWLMVWGGWRLAQGHIEGFPLAVVGTLTMVLVSAALTTVAEGFWIGLVLYTPYLLALVVWGRP